MEQQKGSNIQNHAHELREYFSSKFRPYFEQNNLSWFILDKSIIDSILDYPNKEFVSDRFLYQIMNLIYKISQECKKIIKQKDATDIKEKKWKEIMIGFGRQWSRLKQNINKNKHQNTNVLRQAADFLKDLENQTNRSIGNFLKFDKFHINDDINMVQKEVQNILLEVKNLCSDGVRPIIFFTNYLCRFCKNIQNELREKDLEKQSFKLFSSIIQSKSKRSTSRFYLIETILTRILKYVSQLKQNRSEKLIYRSDENLQIIEQINKYSRDYKQLNWQCLTFKKGQTKDKIKQQIDQLIKRKMEDSEKVLKEFKELCSLAERQMGIKFDSDVKLKGHNIKGKLRVIEKILYNNQVKCQLNKRKKEDNISDSWFQLLKQGLQQQQKQKIKSQFLILIQNQNYSIEEYTQHQLQYLQQYPQNFIFNKLQKQQSYNVLFNITDMVRAKLTFSNLYMLQKCITWFRKRLQKPYCFQQSPLKFQLYKIENKLEGKNLSSTSDVVIKLDIINEKENFNVVAEIQFVLDERDPKDSSYKVGHKLYEYTRSILPSKLAFLYDFTADLAFQYLDQLKEFAQFYSRNENDKLKKELCDDFKKFLEKKQIVGSDISVGKDKRMNTFPSNLKFKKNLQDIKAQFNTLKIEQSFRKQFQQYNEQNKFNISLWSSYFYLQNNDFEIVQKMLKPKRADKLRKQQSQTETVNSQNPKEVHQPQIQFYQNKIRGTICKKKTQYCTAIKYYQQAKNHSIENHFEKIQLRMQLGYCYTQIGDENSALKNFKQGYDIIKQKLKGDIQFTQKFQNGKIRFRLQENDQLDKIQLQILAGYFKKIASLMYLRAKQQQKYGKLQFRQTIWNFQKSISIYQENLTYTVQQATTLDNYAIALVQFYHFVNEYRDKTVEKNKQQIGFLKETVEKNKQQIGFLEGSVPFDVIETFHRKAQNMISILLGKYSKEYSEFLRTFGIYLYEKFLLKKKRFIKIDYEKNQDLLGDALKNLEQSLQIEKIIQENRGKDNPSEVKQESQQTKFKQDKQIEKNIKKQQTKKIIRIIKSLIENKIQDRRKELNRSLFKTLHQRLNNTNDAQRRDQEEDDQLKHYSQFVGQISFQNYLKSTCLILGPKNNILLTAAHAVQMPTFRQQMSQQYNDKKITQLKQSNAPLTPKSKAYYFSKFIKGKKFILTQREKTCQMQIEDVYVPINYFEQGTNQSQVKNDWALIKIKDNSDYQKGIQTGKKMNLQFLYLDRYDHIYFKRIEGFIWTFYTRSQCIFDIKVRSDNIPYQSKGYLKFQGDLIEHDINTTIKSSGAAIVIQTKPSLLTKKYYVIGLHNSCCEYAKKNYGCYFGKQFKRIFQKWCQPLQEKYFEILNPFAHTTQSNYHIKAKFKIENTLVFYDDQQYRSRINSSIIKKVKNLLEIMIKLEQSGVFVRQQLIPLNFVFNKNNDQHDFQLINLSTQQIYIYADNKEDKTYQQLQQNNVTVFFKFVQKFIVKSPLTQKLLNKTNNYKNVQQIINSLKQLQCQQNQDQMQKQLQNQQQQKMQMKQIIQPMVLDNEQKKILSWCFDTLKTPVIKRINHISLRLSCSKKGFLKSDLEFILSNYQIELQNRMQGASIPQKFDISGNKKLRDDLFLTFSIFIDQKIKINSEEKFIQEYILYIKKLYEQNFKNFRQCNKIVASLMEIQQRFIEKILITEILLYTSQYKDMGKKDPIIQLISQKISGQVKNNFDLSYRERYHYSHSESIFSFPLEINEESSQPFSEFFPVRSFKSEQYNYIGQIGYYKDQYKKQWSPLATGTLIHQKYIITAVHAFDDKKSNKNLEFYFTLIVGDIPPKKITFKSSSQIDDIGIFQLQEDDIGIFQLQKDMKSSDVQYPRIGIITGSRNVIYCDCFGYPSQTSRKTIIQGYLYRTSSIFAIKDTLLFDHDMYTTEKMSGSPIFSYFSNGQGEIKRYIIGIHRESVKAEFSINKGQKINMELIKKIKKYKQLFRYRQIRVKQKQEIKIYQAQMKRNIELFYKKDFDFFVLKLLRKFYCYESVYLTFKDIKLSNILVNEKSIRFHNQFEMKVDDPILSTSIYYNTTDQKKDQRQRYFACIQQIIKAYEQLLNQKFNQDYSFTRFQQLSAFPIDFNKSIKEIMHNKIRKLKNNKTLGGYLSYFYLFYDVNNLTNKIELQKQQKVIQRITKMCLANYEYFGNQFKLSTFKQKKSEVMLRSLQVRYLMEVYHKAQKFSYNQIYSLKRQEGLAEQINKQIMQKNKATILQNDINFIFQQDNQPNQQIISFCLVKKCQTEFTEQIFQLLCLEELITKDTKISLKMLNRINKICEKYQLD